MFDSGARAVAEGDGSILGQFGAWGVKAWSDLNETEMQEHALGTADVVRLEPSDKVLFELLTERLEENDVSIEVDLTPASCASVAEAVEGFPHPSLNAKLFLMMHS